MKYTYLLWDFNGTILSDMQACINSVNKMLLDRGLPMIDGIDSYREVFDFPICEYYRGLGFDFEAEPFEVLAPIWVALYNENSQSSGLCEGVLETLDAVARLGIGQVILSASEKTMLEAQISALGVKNYFEDVMGLDNIHAESKIELAKKWRRAHPNEKVLYIGDTVHDADTAKALGADCLLYSGGHQSKKRLESCGFPIIEKISELIAYLK